MNKPFVVCFAGVPGCGKSSVAHELSLDLGVPRFERDIIRQEVKDDFWTSDINDPDAFEEFSKRSKLRINNLIDKRQSFVLDSSVDRTWNELKDNFEKNGYQWFIISFDVSDERMKRVYDLYKNSDPAEISHYSAQHQAFLKKYQADVGLSITDNNFKDRLKLSLEAVQNAIA